MILAVVDDIPYKIILLLHILTAFLAFSPIFVYPLLPGQMRPVIMPEQQRLVVTMFVNMRSLYGPSLILTGLLGFALAGLSNGAHSLTEGWLLVAIGVWILMNGVFHAIILPAMKTMSAKYLSESDAKQVLDFAAENIDKSTLEQLDSSNAPELMASATERAIKTAKKSKTTVAEQIAATTATERIDPATAKQIAEAAAEQALAAEHEHLLHLFEDLLYTGAAEQALAAEDEHTPTLDAINPDTISQIAKAAAEQALTVTHKEIDHKTAKQLVAYTTKNLQRGSALMTILLIIELYLMIWQPTLFQL